MKRAPKNTAATGDSIQINGETGAVGEDIATDVDAGNTDTLAGTPAQTRRGRPAGPVLEWGQNGAAALLQTIADLTAAMGKAPTAEEVSDALNGHVAFAGQSASVTPVKVVSHLRRIRKEMVKSGALGNGSKAFPVLARRPRTGGAAGRKGTRLDLAALQALLPDVDAGVNAA